MGSRADKDKADRKGQGCAACGMNLDSKSGSSAGKIFGIWSHGATHAAGVLLVWPNLASLGPPSASKTRLHLLESIEEVT